MNKSLNDRLVKVLMLKLIPRVPCIVIKRNNRALLFPGTCSPMTVKNISRRFSPSSIVYIIELLNHLNHFT